MKLNTLLKTSSDRQYTVPLILSDPAQANSETRISSRTTPPTASTSGSDEASVRPRRRKSIPVVLQATENAGQYTINTEDSELRALLKQGFERSKAGIVQKKKSQFRDLVLKKQFTAFDRLNTGDLPSFHGFFTLFWIGVFLMILRVAANNWRHEGSILGKNEIVRLMLSKDLVLLGVVDCLMMSAGLISTGIQVLICRGWFEWSGIGWIIQNIWQFIFLTGFIGFSRLRDWPWTHAVFITLHTITMLMKQHSYAFYNGYLSEVYKRRHRLQLKLDLLEDPANMTPASPLLTAHATSYFDIADLSHIHHRRRPSAHSDDSNDNLTSVIEAIQSDKSLNYEQLRALRTLISEEITTLEEELKGTCKNTSNYYPTNLSAKDWFLYLPLPTVVYELEYPREPSIRWSYVAEKVAATFGTLFVMNITATAYIYPVVIDIMKMKELGVPVSRRLQEFPWAFLDLLFPLMMQYLLSWYVIWECVLNVLAEITRFADRGFYSDWWNSVSWDNFARDWNRPVHNFLLRHAYHSSISTYQLSRTNATIITFLISACVHELLMSVVFGKIRGYLLVLQMSQLPLVWLSRTKYLRGKDILGNAIFWIGIFIGPSFLCSLYLFL